MIDFAVIGGGIGGVSVASLLNREHKVKLFEKESYLGGCSGTFFRDGFGYNIGATTFALYGRNSPVKRVFDEVGVTPDVYRVDPAITVLIDGKQINRYFSFDKYLKEIDRAFPDMRNREFLKLIKDISDIFYDNIDSIKYDRGSILKTLNSFLSISKLFFKLPKIAFRNSRSVIESFYPDIDREFLNFIENQTLIVAQTKELQKLPFIIVALSLSYTLYKNYYPIGGMSSVLNSLAEKIDDVNLADSVTSIEKSDKEWIVTSKSGTYRSKNIILNSSIVENSHLFKDREIREELDGFKKLDTGQSAFILYLKIESDKEFKHHYQIIESLDFPFSISNSIFVSFSDVNDNTISKQGFYSVTVSIHTETDLWKVDKSEYKKRKETLSKRILESLQKELNIDSSEIVDSFSASPLTFKRYIGRSSLGGLSPTYKNIPKIISQNIGVDGVYFVGDNSFMGQGWPGVVQGALNLKRIIDDKRS